MLGALFAETQLANNDYYYYYYYDSNDEHESVEGNGSRKESVMMMTAICKNGQQNKENLLALRDNGDKSALPMPSTNHLATKLDYR